MLCFPRRSTFTPAREMHLNDALFLARTDMNGFLTPFESLSLRFIYSISAFSGVRVFIHAGWLLSSYQQK
jgi:hypothetical protein